MTKAQNANAELDALIGELTIDAYDQDEQVMGFENYFDETHHPSRVAAPSSAKK